MTDFVIKQKQLFYRKLKQVELDRLFHSCVNNNKHNRSFFGNN